MGAQRHLPLAYPPAGILTHFHFSLTGVEGPAALVESYLCPLGAHLKEWDMKARWEQTQGPLQLPVPPAPDAASACCPPCPCLLTCYQPHHMTPQVDSLTGPLPTDTPTCLPRLEEYDLSRNKLTGTIPPEVRLPTVQLCFVGGEGGLAGSARLCARSPLLIYLKVA